jgi:hypothetical protein
LEHWKHWDFYPNEQQHWGWRELNEHGHVLQNSKQLFATRTDCIVDAMHNGYLTRPLTAANDDSATRQKLPALV